MSAPHDPLVCGLPLTGGKGDCPGCVALVAANTATVTDAERAEAAAYRQQIEIDRLVGEIADLLGCSADETRALVPRLRRAMLHVHAGGAV